MAHFMKDGHFTLLFLFSGVRADPMNSAKLPWLKTWKIWSKNYNPRTSANLLAIILYCFLFELITALSISTFSWAAQEADWISNVVLKHRNRIIGTQWTQPFSDTILLKVDLKIVGLNAIHIFLTLSHPLAANSILDTFRLQAYKYWVRNDEVFWFAQGRVIFHSLSKWKSPFWVHDSHICVGPTYL